MLGLVLLLPLAFSVVASLMKWTLVPRNLKWLGVGNYTKIFQDTGFWHSMGLTLRFTTLSVGLEMLLGFLIAMFLNTDFRGCKFVRVVVLLPMMLSPTVIALVFKLMLNYDRGIVNEIVTALFGATAKQVWLGKDLAFYSVLVVDVWINTSFVVLNVLAGLQSVSVDIMEASVIDGANAWQRATRITIPLIKPILLVALIFRTTFALRSFPIAYVLTGGGPANYTQFYALELYKQAFTKYNVGYASALSWILILITFGLSVAYTKLTMKGEK
jgi:multiple sugar transport system permease protein